MSICEKSLSASVFTESLGQGMPSLCLSWTKWVAWVACLCPTSSQWRLQPKWQTTLTCWWPCKNPTERTWQRLNLEWVHWTGIWKWVFVSGTSGACFSWVAKHGRSQTRKNNAPQGCQYMIVWYVLEVFVLWCKMGVKEKMSLFLAFGLRHCFFLVPTLRPSYSLFHCSHLANSAKVVLFLFFDITQYYTYVRTHDYRYTTYIYIYIYGAASLGSPPVDGSWSPPKKKYIIGWLWGMPPYSFYKTYPSPSPKF